MPNTMTRARSFRLLNIVTIVAAGCLLTAGPAFAAQELKMIEHATIDAVTDTGASGDSAGGILTFANEVYDADDKAKIGSDQGICFRTVPSKAWECFWTLSLDKGQLTVEGRSTMQATRSSPLPAGPASLPVQLVTWR